MPRLGWRLNVTNLLQDRRRLSLRLATVMFRGTLCLKDEKQQREFPSFLAPTVNVQGVPKNVGIQWRIRYRLCYELALWIVIPNFKSQNIIMSARVYFMKRVKDFTMSLLCLRKMYSDGGQVYSVCILQFSCFT